MRETRSRRRRKVSLKSGVGSVGGGWGPSIAAYLSRARTGLTSIIKTNPEIRRRDFDPTIARFKSIGPAIFITKIGWATPVRLPEASIQAAIPKKPGRSPAIDNDPDRGRAVGVLDNIGGLMLGKVNDDI